MNNEKREIVPKSEAPEVLPDNGVPIAIGEWYWVKVRDEKDWFGCVTEIGSNYAEFTNPYESTTRVHFKDFDKLCRKEKDPAAIVQGKISHYKGIVREKLNEIREVTARLGVDPRPTIGHAEESSSRALSVLSGNDNLKKYKKDLIAAKDKKLPALFKEVKEANEELTHWMTADMLALQAASSGLEETIERIKGRIFNVSLYAGLTEEVEQLTDGAPAGIAEKLRIMQRLCYMDEECLVNYRHGGMEFDNIGEFDDWLVKPENRDRILPFPRCMVAFRVRREAKDRGPAYDLSTAYIHFKLEKLDELTFLYIRNGRRVYRMNCDLEFGEWIFPGRDEFRLDEPMMAHVDFSEVKTIITRRHYEELLKDEKQSIEDEKRKHEEWKKQNPDKDDFFSPHRSYFTERELRELETEYEPFNKDSVYYDEMKEEIERRVQHYNRIALIVQGLYDRSEVLHPHPPVRLWSPDGSAAAIELIYADHGLYHGDAPDYEEYRKTLNKSLRKGSITIGQEHFFEVREAEKYNARYHRGNYHPEEYSPPGNPGPGYIAEVVEWTRTGKATFRWTRERQFSNWYEGKKYGDPIPTSIQVPAEHLFNVSAYKMGDYKRFYADPRSRAKYLRWAPILLAAEEWKAGNVEKDGRLKKKKKKGRK